MAFMGYGDRKGQTTVRARDCQGEGSHPDLASAGEVNPAVSGKGAVFRGVDKRRGHLCEETERQ